jgi:hypothetical protein
MTRCSPDRVTGLIEQLAQVNSRQSFLRFAENLRRDFITNPAEWENDQLDSFLEAIVAWTSDIDAYYRNRDEALPKEPSWKMLAEILYAGKGYE